MTVWYKAPPPRVVLVGLPGAGVSSMAAALRRVSAGDEAGPLIATEAPLLGGCGGGPPSDEALDLAYGRDDVVLLVADVHVVGALEAAVALAGALRAFRRCPCCVIVGAKIEDVRTPRAVSAAAANAAAAAAEVEYVEASAHTGLHIRACIDAVRAAAAAGLQVRVGQGVRDARCRHAEAAGRVG